MIEFSAPIELSFQNIVHNIIECLFDVIIPKAKERTDKLIFTELSDKFLASKLDIDVDRNTIISIGYPELSSLEPGNDISAVVSFYHFTGIPDYENQRTIYYWSGTMVVNTKEFAIYYQFFEDINADFALTYANPIVDQSNSIKKK